MTEFQATMFSPETFYNLPFKVADQSIQLTVCQKQWSIKYYTSLRMETMVKLSTLTYLRILCKPVLNALGKVLGNGVGLGLMPLSKDLQVKAEWTLILHILNVEILRWRRS